MTLQIFKKMPLRPPPMRIHHYYLKQRSYQFVKGIKDRTPALNMIIVACWDIAALTYMITVSFWAGRVASSTRHVLLQLLNPRTQDELVKWGNVEVRRREMLKANIRAEVQRKLAKKASWV